jgi:type II secretory pathway component PulJ
MKVQAMIRSYSFVPALAIGSLVLVSACTMPGERATSSSGSRAVAASIQPLSPAMVQQVQARLQQLGMYNGNVDGVWGPATEASVRTYQKSQGMVVTGQLDSPTIAAMNLDGSSNQPLAAGQMPPAMGAR